MQCVGGSSGGGGGAILIALGGFIIATFALTFGAVRVRVVVVKVAMFVIYIMAALAYSVSAIGYGVSVGMAGWMMAACALWIGLAIILMLLLLMDASRRQRERDIAAATGAMEHGAQAPNYVPSSAAARRPRYRSVTRRTLHAIKIYRPREHYAVPDAHRAEREEEK